MSDVTNGIFSDYCYEKMWDLFKYHDNEVGIKFQGNKAGRSVTSCIIYVSNVLIYAHNKINRSDISNTIQNIGITEQDGSKLAKYLVEQLGWNAHYWNPDVASKEDNSEHYISYNQVLNTKRYLPRSTNLPISGLIIDYNKKNKKNETAWIPSGSVVPIVNVPIPMPVSVSTDNLAILNKLSKVKFAYGIARGATHTFLVSYGEIFEVHWASEGAKLYGKLPFEKYEWLSGALVIPPDSNFTSAEVKEKLNEKN